MATVVLVHGIGQEQLGPATLKQRWRAALSDGVWKTGDIDLAARLERFDRADAVDVAIPYYADVFEAVDIQGDVAQLDRLDPVEAAVVDELARCLLARATVVAQPAWDRETAHDELARLEGPLGEEQGACSAVRPVVAALARLRWFAPFGMAVAQRFVIRSLVQVTRYLREPPVRDAVQTRVAEQIDESTRVLIGHSLGSVVAFEAACRLGRPLPLLVTLGSPLGLRTIVYDRLRPHPPRFPEQVSRWVNVSADDDLVAVVPDLTDLFEPTRPPTSHFLGGGTVENGSSPHDLSHYLSKAAVGEPVAEALR